ncbi:TIGR03943 family protein [Mycolicibacterium madagascariense]|uniref:TIGR03943 family protein n=1 Tax=Mycolicibacterium madagascariense TaxID=212765 RepID=A0A7I7XMN5_9MYCO|nr:TIGR03943 family protein [Mycolicibacterium madagascariense]MCV7013191.1 TIGR03943 family protein [Mycolicibacterium madagascariense]BBZ30501.1 TIGR03943 family protein [Mycolicibacterium madagascariense]
MSRGAQNLVLLLIGLATAVMLVKGTYLNYVRPMLLPWLAAAAAGLIALGLVAIVTDLRNAHHEHQDADDGHGHRHRTWLGWLLLVPIAMVAFVVPPALGANGASAAPAISQPHRRAFPPLPAGDAPTVSLPEVVMRAAADSTNSLVGRSITLTGFTLHRPNGIDLGRVVIVCCAADAQLARVHLTGPGAAAAAGHADDSWLRIKGQIVPGSSHSDDGFIPTMTVTDVTSIDKPANTYAY